MRSLWSVAALLVLVVVSGRVVGQDDEKKQGHLSLCLDHSLDEGQKCAIFAAGKHCSELGHWKFDVKGMEYGDAESLGALIQEEVRKDRKYRDQPEPDPSKPAPSSELKVTIYAGSRAPWGRVQMALNACAQAGVYKVSFCAASMAEERAALKAGKKLDRPEPIKVWLPKDSAPITVDEDGKVATPPEVRVIVDYDRGSAKVTRKVGDKEVADDDALVAAIEKGLKAGKNPSGASIVIDAPWYAPFGEIHHVVALCKKKDLAPVEFAQPAPVEKR